MEGIEGNCSMEFEKKDMQVNLRLSKDEYEKLKRASEISGMNKSDIIRYGMINMCGRIDEMDARHGHDKDFWSMEKWQN